MYNSINIIATEVLSQSTKLIVRSNQLICHWKRGGVFLDPEDFESLQMEISELADTCEFLVHQETLREEYEQTLSKESSRLNSLNDKLFDAYNGHGAVFAGEES